ncbi:putative AAA family ATPase [Candidatus Termititenax persephonae]|uniref:AAA family ATPase n=1 Tax=Candidatus Termititenax persephonae TaxID=2218525 RepID=A0A388TJK8_9BACT|nr:putative AAA family ATPase [Candidatus Termititenax persephonae]
MKARKITQYINTLIKRPTGRILVFTGARQTGKTTLTKRVFPDYEYLSIEDPINRIQYAKLTAAQWQELYPRAILDEVQKEPQLVESIKSVYDQWPQPRYILLGSSQLLLLEKIKESLAGRCSIIELFPLTIPELATASWTDEMPDSLFQRYAKNPDKPLALLPSFLLDKNLAVKKKAWAHYVRFGAYPALTNPDLSDEERYNWLRDYVRTYLERDVRDLASFRDLEPFVKLQHALVLRTAQTLNASSLATEIGLSVKTVQRYIHYLDLSYQTLLLPAWSRNAGKRLVKMPKVHCLDNGVLQAVLQKRGGLTGAEFESLVVAELYKQLRSVQIYARLYHLRTQTGYEVDLLLELPQGYIAFEIKMAEKVNLADLKRLQKLNNLLDKPLLQAFVLSNDEQTYQIAPNLTAVSAAYFLG